MLHFAPRSARSPKRLINGFASHSRSSHLLAFFCARPLQHKPREAERPRSRSLSAQVRTRIADHPISEKKKTEQKVPRLPCRFSTSQS